MDVQRWVREQVRKGDEAAKELAKEGVGQKAEMERKKKRKSLAPNPLSVKKKKGVKDGKSVEKKEDGEHGKKRKRKRTKRKKGETVSLDQAEKKDIDAS